MKGMLRIYLLDENGEKVFGEGPYRLLKGIESGASLRKTAMEMQMAYSKALRILKRAEDAFGAPLTERAVGGRDGGGSHLTDAGRNLIQRYELYRRQCEEAEERARREIFPEFEFKRDL